MKIGIITVFYSENTGSVLQAYALAKALEFQGHSVEFINTINKFSSHGMKALISNMVKDILKFRWSNISYTIRQYIEFDRFLKKFSIYDSKSNEKIDCFILGSDTIWDVNSKYFLASQNLFWGDKIDGNKIVYAASVANSTLEQIMKLIYPEQNLNKMEYISVRDAYSYSVISELVDREIAQVCDPTMLLNYNDYRELIINSKEQSKYLLIYIFEELEPEIINKIVKYANVKGLKTISFGRKRKWCTESCCASVQDFITLFANADYIVTNTFHGTVFSLIFKKQFVSVTKKKKKVVELLSQLDLRYRLATDVDEIAMCFDDIINYKLVNEQLEEIREKSLTYLKASINHCEKASATGE